MGPKMHRDALHTLSYDTKRNDAFRREDKYSLRPSQLTTFSMKYSGSSLGSFQIPRHLEAGLLRHASLSSPHVSAAFASSNCSLFYRGGLEALWRYITFSYMHYRVTGSASVMASHIPGSWRPV